jgi:hypothetical protein
MRDIVLNHNSWFQKENNFLCMRNINTVSKVRSRVHSDVIEAYPGTYKKNDVNYGARHTQNILWCLKYK